MDVSAVDNATSRARQWLENVEEYVAYVVRHTDDVVPRSRKDADG